MPWLVAVKDTLDTVMLPAFFFFLDSRNSAFIFSFAWRSGNTRFTDGLFMVRIRSPLGLTRIGSTLPEAPSVLMVISGLGTAPDDESSFLHPPTKRITITTPNTNASVKFFVCFNDF